MAMRKLSKPSDQRKAMLRSLTTALLWYGKIETTEARAKEVRSIAEKIITKAIRTYEDTVAVTKNGEEFVNDGPKKLAARRAIMAYVYEIPEAKQDKESKYEYFERTRDNRHPVVEKIFRDLAPKYDKRAKELGQGGGYTRIIKKGPRKGDAAETVIIELV